MKKKISVISVLFVVAILIAACSPAPAADAPAVEADSVQTDLNVEEEPLPAENTAPASPDLPDYPDWYSAQLSDVNSGEVFTISENIGKVYNAIIDTDLEIVVKIQVNSIFGSDRIISREEIVKITPKKIVVLDSTKKEVASEIITESL